MVRVSVIIPNYNHAAFLAQRIESVLAQSHPPTEIILLDDASTDESRTVLEQYRDHPLVTQLIINEKNSGSPFQQWQKGLALAQYEWIWIAESDDRALPHFLEKAVSSIGNKPDAGIYYCNSELEPEYEQSQTTADICKKLLQQSKWDTSYEEKGLVEIKNALQYHSTIMNVSAVLFKKEPLQNALSAIKPFRYYGDWFIYIHILATYDIIYEATVQNIFCRTEHSFSMQMNKQSRLGLKAECFHILLLLYRMPYLADKKALLRWHVSRYTGFGVLSDGPVFMVRLLSRYFSINFGLTMQVLKTVIALKFAGGNKK